MAPKKGVLLFLDLDLGTTSLYYLLFHNHHASLKTIRRLRAWQVSEVIHTVYEIEVFSNARDVCV